MKKAKNTKNEWDEQNELIRNQRELEHGWHTIAHSMPESCELHTELRDTMEYIHGSYLEMLEAKMILDTVIEQKQDGKDHSMDDAFWDEVYGEARRMAEACGIHVVFPGQERI